MSAGIDPTLPPVPVGDFSQIPSAPADPQRQGTLDTLADSMSLNWFMQSADRLVEQLYPSVPGYDPMQEPRLKGRENWAPYLWDARSPDEFHARLDRFQDNEDRRARGSVNDTLWTNLAAGVADPLNLVPIPAGMVGKGLVRGALAGAAVNAGLAIPSYLVRRAFDPTQPDSLREELFYGAAFGAVLGGLGGVSVGDYHPTVARIARDLSERQAYLDGELNPILGGSGLEVPARLTKFEARGSTGTEGIKSAGFLEKLIGNDSILNPFGSVWGGLVQSGHRALQDFAQLMGGDGGLTLKDAEQGIAATGPSAWLAAGRWKAIAADTLAELHQAYAEYLGKPDSATVAGLNLTTTGARLGDLARKVTGQVRADGKMAFDEYLEAVMLAHRADRLEPNLDRMRDKRPEAASAVMKGAKITRQFFDHADREGTGAGFLKEPYQNYLKRRFDILDRRRAEAERLEKIVGRTPSEEARLRRLKDEIIPRVGGTIPERAHLERSYQDLRRQWDEEIKAGKKPAELKGLDEALRELEAKGAFLRREPRAAQGRDIQPDTWDPGDHTASNEPPLAETRVNREPVNQVPEGMRPANDGGEPPVPAGHTRLYHGSAEHGRYDGKAWFSTNREYAEKYRDGAELQYVDVPTEKINALADPDGYGQTPDKGFTFNHEFDSAEIGPRKPLHAKEGADPHTANDNHLPGEHEPRLPDGGFQGWELVPANENQALAGAKADAHYLTRRWNNEAVRSDPEGLRAAIEASYLRRGLTPMTDEEWGKTLANILGGQEAGQERFSGTPVGGLFRKGRKLDVPNEDVADFIERNVGSLILEYSHRFGTGLEVHKRFGQRDALDAIDDALLKGLEERTGTVEDLLAWADQTSDKMKYLRDQTLGDLHVQDPLNMGKVTAEFLKAWASTAMLGRVVYSQLVETTRPLMTHGFQRNFQFITDNMIGNLAAFKAAGRDLRSLVGEAIDTAHGATGARLMEMGDLNRPGSSLAQKTRAALDPFMKAAHGPWYIVNGMGPITDLTKNYMMVMSSHFLIEDMRKLVDGSASPKTVELLAAQNINRDLAQQILQQKIEVSGKLNVANLSAWDDQALAHEFAAAVRIDTNRAINTPSPQTKSAISQGFFSYGDGRRQWAMVTLPFQFMSWGLSAAQKISMSALQGRDANAMAGIATLIGAGYLSQWLKSSQAAWDRTPVEERIFRAVDQSGALAVVGNLNSMIEAGTFGQFGLRPAFGMEPGYGPTDGYDAAGVALGPVGHLAGDIAKAFTDPTLTEWQKATLLRKAAPANGLWGVNSLFQGLQAGAFDAFGIDHP